ncbi:acid-shock protein, partial [Salmonella enterica subsp. enterica serovar Anatum]|nr:acid-shock protein [Salmonella enterica subsp. enterica serovar Anatum]MDI5448900.1 acid-shock protein [Salmonella enterica subsp. enterica serovar Anatum]
QKKGGKAPAKTTSKPTTQPAA